MRFIVFLTCWLSLLVFTDTCLSQPQNQPNPGFGAVPAKKTLTYDGKSFEYWQTLCLTELKSDNRIDAMHAMGAFGVKGYAKESAEVIVSVMSEYDLSKFGYEWKTKPKSPDEKLVAEGIWAIHKIGSQGFLATLKKLKNKNVAQFAVTAFGRDYVASQDCVSPLIELSQSGEEIESAFAITYLAAGLTGSDKFKSSFHKHFNGKDVPPYAKKIGKVMDVGYTYVSGDPSASAFTILQELGPQAQSELPKLVHYVFHNYGSASPDEFLQRLKVSKEEVLDAVLLCLDKSTISTQVQAAIYLSKQGKRAKVAIPKLLKLLEQPIPDVSPDRASPADFDYSRSYVFAQSETMKALVSLGADKNEVIPALSKFLNNKKAPRQLQIDALLIISKLKPTPQQEIPVLIQALKTIVENEHYGKHSIQTKKTYYKSDGVLRYPAYEMVELNSYYKQLIVGNLGTHGSKAKQAVPLIIQAYSKRGKWYPDTVCIEALGNIGPDAKEALPLLESASKTDVDSIRAAARIAIRKITQSDS